MELRLCVRLWFLLGMTVIGSVNTAQSQSGEASMRLALDNANISSIGQLGQRFFSSFLPDGTAVVFQQTDLGNSDIYIQRIDESTATNLTGDSAAVDTQPSVSPDGKWIAFRSSRDGGGIFVMGIQGDSVRRIAGTDTFNPSWSPNGKEIVYATESVSFNPYARSSNNSQLWIAEVATGQRRQLPAPDGVQPAWSPNGQRIAYWSIPATGGGQRDLWTISTQGADPVRVTNDSATDWNPVWSADGRYLYFASDRSGKMNLWRVRINQRTGRTQGRPQAVTRSEAEGMRGHISFTQNGNRFVFVDQWTSQNIYKVGFDPDAGRITGQPSPVTRGVRQLAQPEASADGQWVVFRSAGTREDIYVIRSDGSLEQQLTKDLLFEAPGNYKDRSPRWSPDGKRILFYSDRSGRYQLWLMNVDGTELQQITDAQTSIQGGVWSPDGRRIAFYGAEQPVRILDVTKTWEEQRPVTLPTFDAATGDYFTVRSWSPDGKFLAGARVNLRQAVAGFGVFSIEHNRYETLVNVGAVGMWLNDSRRLMYASDGKLFLFDRQSKEQREVSWTPPPGSGSFSLSPDNRNIYFIITDQDSRIRMVTMRSGF